MKRSSNVWTAACLGASLWGAGGCRTTGWQGGPALLVTPRAVAEALNDPADLGQRQTFNPADVPVPESPHRVRPCCAFGVDLKAKVGAAPVPGYEISNITSADALGPHEYDNGNATVRPGHRHAVVLEQNGLVYTCRGGFIDTAHIRDNADRVLYAGMQLARALPVQGLGVTFDYAEEGTLRRVVVKPVPDAIMRRHGRWRTAALMAGWINFQLSVCHEIITWYGWESTKGFSEKVSAFSPEDLYSNVVGLRVAIGILTNREALSRDDYDHAMDGWIPATLHRLQSVSRAEGRAAMQAVDGLWWDSRKRLPDWKLVLRRYFEIESPLSGWLVSEAVPKAQRPLEVDRMCKDAAPPLPLEVPERLGDTEISDLVTIQFQFSGWLPEHFPVPAGRGDIVTSADFGKIIAQIRRENEREMGTGADRPQSLRRAESQ